MNRLYCQLKYYYTLITINVFVCCQGYVNCTCLSLYKNYQSSNTSIHVTGGKCTDNCRLLYLFLPILLLTIFFRFAQSTPALSVTLR